jgi:preprotein translocase subunit SecD
MFENLNARMFVVGFVLLVSLVWTMPNFVNTSEMWWPSQDKLAYGLDIQGGLHLVLGIDVEDAVEARISKLGFSMKRQLKEEKKIDLGDVTVLDPSVGKMRVNFQPADRQAVLDYMEDSTYGQGQTFQILETNSDHLVARFYESELRVFTKSLVDRTIETIRNRVDEIGVKEPTIAAQSDRRILVQLPGVEDSANTKDIINRTAKLQFMIWHPDYMFGAQDGKVEGSPQFSELQTWVAEAEAQQGFALWQDGLGYSDFLKKLNEALQDKLPKNTVVRFEKAPNAKTLEAGKIPYVLQTDAMMGGETLNDASVTLDQVGQPIVVFSFDAKGAKEFGDLTSANVGKMMAIVLDGVVQTAPRLKEAITGGRGSIEMGSLGDRQKTLDEANATALVLRSGALPAELEQLEERTVGPTLGKDSIEKGKYAGLIGGVLVFVFMLIYYRSYGVLADLALTFNILMILAILTSLQATLTLPGVAGIVLTIGMAVDANVIIFERIKEELAKGAGLLGAIKEGYARAFTAILDANITTAAVCVVLMYFGTGPIRGFAVTLLIGIITSMFTAIFFTRTILNFMVGKLKLNIRP